MTPEQMSSDFQNKFNQLKEYTGNGFPVMAERKALRFIAGNFSKQGYQGSTFKKWKENKRKRKILWLHGNLARSNRAQKGFGEVRIFNDAIYAKAHNEGLTIQHPGGVRTLAFKKYSKGKFQGRILFHKNNADAHFGQKVNVGPYSIKMPKRQFMPITTEDAPDLIKSITKDIKNTINQIFNK